MQNDGPERHTGARGAGFVRLYRKEKPRVMARLRRLGIQGADVEEIAQAVFLAYIETPTIPPNPRAWLLNAASKLAANHRRLFRRRFEVLSPPHELETLAVDPAPSPEWIAALGQWCDRGASLPQSEREALALHVQGYSARESAALLGASKTAICARVRRARKALDTEEK